MNVLIVIAIIIFLIISIYFPRIIAPSIAVASFMLCLDVAYVLFGFWGAVIVGIITVSAIIYVSYKILAFLEKHPEWIQRKKD